MRLYAPALMLIRLVYLVMVRVPAWPVQVLRPGGIQRGSARALIAQAGKRVPESRSLAAADNLGPTPLAFPGAFAMRISPASPAAAKAPAYTADGTHKSRSGAVRTARRPTGNCCHNERISCGLIAVQ